MRRWTTVPLARAASAALFLVGLTVAPAFAWPDRLSGRPEQLHPGGDAGYYIWTEDDDGETVHLSTTGPGPEHRFRAVIMTDGELEDVDQARLEEGDGYELQDGGRILVVDLHTWDGVDNVRWHVRGGSFLAFDLRVDGRPIRPDNVYLGEQGVHPRSPSFRVLR